MELNPEYLASLQEQRHGVGGGGAGSGQVAGSRRSKGHDDDDEGSDHRGSGVRGANGRQLALVQAGIQYHNGPVGPVTGTALNVYVIWYGNWQSTTFNTSTANPVAIITDLLSNIGGSKWYNIQTSYTNASGAPLTNTVKLSGSRFIGTAAGNSSYAKSITDVQIRTMVTDSIPAFHPITRVSDRNGVYLFLSSSDVVASSGFCTLYCGFHSYISGPGSIAGSNTNASSMKFAYIGDPARCPAACSSLGSSTSAPTPNSSFSADAMASILLHELAEAHSDPNMNAWYDTSGAENADKCAWTYGTVSRLANNAPWNMVVGTRRYLIQRNWLNSGTTGSCSSGV